MPRHHNLQRFNYWCHSTEDFGRFFSLRGMQLHFNFPYFHSLTFTSVVDKTALGYEIRQNFASETYDIFWNEKMGLFCYMIFSKVKIINTW